MGSPLHRILAMGAGALLVGAAVLKSLDAEPVDLSLFEALNGDRLRPILIAWEVFLGVWLLSGEWRSLATVAGAGTFAVFAVAAGFNGWIGQASCRCFGPVPTDPWLMVAVDSALAIGLLGTGPWWRRQAGDAVERVRGREAIRVASTCLPIALVFGFGVPSEIAAWVRGDAFRIDENRANLGDARPGDILTREVEVRNVSGSPQRLVGGSQDCSCRVSGLSASVGPNERSTIRIDIRVPADATPGRYCRPVEVYTDAPDQPILRLDVSCRVR